MGDSMPLSLDTHAAGADGGAERISAALVSPAWPPDAFPNGVIPYVDKIAASLRRQGQGATVLAGLVRGEIDGVTVRGYRSRTGTGGLLSRGVDRLAEKIAIRLGQGYREVRDLIGACRKLIDEQGLQVVEMEEAFGMPYWVRKALPIPVVVRLHGPWFLNGSFGPEDDAFRARVRAEGLAIEAADSITSPSLDVLERTRAFYNLPLEGALVFPPPTVMVPEADRWQAGGDDPNLVLFVGRFDRHKGGDLMIRAFAEVARRMPNARLRFVGPDYGLVEGSGRRVGIEDYIRREAPEAAGRIEWLGQMAPAEVIGQRRRARVTVVASRYETFGLTLSEAVTHGCPVVATRAGAFPEIVQDGINGLLCNSEDPADLAEKISTLLADEALAIGLGRRAGRDGEERYQAEALARGLANHYRKVIATAAVRGRPEVRSARD